MQIKITQRISQLNKLCHSIKLVHTEDETVLNRLSDRRVWFGDAVSNCLYYDVLVEQRQLNKFVKSNLTITNVFKPMIQSVLTRVHLLHWHCLPYRLIELDTVGHLILSENNKLRTLWLLCPRLSQPQLNEYHSLSSVMSLDCHRKTKGHHCKNIFTCTFYQCTSEGSS